jgi:nucleoid DNA-binding protein
MQGLENVPARRIVFFKPCRKLKEALKEAAKPGK